MPSTMRKPFNYVETAAVQAAMKRARTGQAGQVGPDPALHSEDAELRWVEAVLRHRLSLHSLDRPVGIRAQNDDTHPLVANGRHFPAVALTIPFADRTLDFLATYNDRGRLTFDVIAPCAQCGKPVPTEEINSLEDLGDYLLQARDTLGGSPRLRTSPAHATDCLARGN
ncbi:hypothetical protein ABZ508_10440 [Streptomyces lavendulocolor]|uniref:Uncharacterized protein n=1 Tax=Streptomyces lavendulocolor TaxID=67316 RepID=A0ABV2W697_9ACTN|nr:MULTISPECIES: hypothetical protein [unclassified Streptomyces]